MSGKWPRMSMLSNLRMMVTCHWAGRRIQSYLDVDPDAPLSAAEVTRLEAHLATCEKCSTITDEHRVLRSALGRWAAASPPDPAAVQRLRVLVDTFGEPGQS